MSNYYNDATAALARMKAVADEISTMIKAIETPIQATIASNLMASQKGTTNWIQWTSLISFRAKHEEWGRKLHGIIMGYSREMESAYKPEASPHLNQISPKASRKTACSRTSCPNRSTNGRSRSSLMRGM
ncbi:hypothetical protein, partial [Corallococcus exiguus]|uniref:hypothetical protein n=1 Tax=Corallococcus exiguus TaxID=83462 RepID=UPI001B8A9F78